MVLSRRHAGSVALLAISTLVALALAELIVRAIAPQPRTIVTPGLYQPATPPLRYLLRAGHRGRVANVTDFDITVAIGPDGLRAAPHAAPDPATAASPDAAAGQALVLGDSFAFGWGVEHHETFAARLEGPDLRVINAGIPGYGMPDYDAWLAQHGSGLGPGVVLVAAFLGNDLLDATVAHREVAIVEGLVSAGPTARGVRSLVDERLHLARLVKRALPPELARRMRGWLGLAEPWAMRYLRQATGSYAYHPPALIAEGRAATAAAFAQLVARAGTAGWTVGLVLVPAVTQVDERAWAAALDLAGGDSASHDPAVPSRFFARLADDHAVPVLDLLPVFRRAAEDDPDLYFRDDPHWTAAGHRLAARAIEPFLDQLLSARAAGEAIGAQ